jgi:hypothetical protein
MEDSEAKIRQQLATAGELFASGKYGQCRKYACGDAGYWQR